MWQRALLPATCHRQVRLPTGADPELTLTLPDCVAALPCTAVTMRGRFGNCFWPVTALQPIVLMGRHRLALAAARIRCSGCLSEGLRAPVTAREL